MRGRITTTPSRFVRSSKSTRLGDAEVRGRGAQYKRISVHMMRARGCPTKPINCNPRDPLAKSGLPEVMPYEALRQRVGGAEGGRFRSVR